MRVAFAHYGVPADVSGVTSWIERFVKRLDGERSQAAVHVLGLGREPWSECSIARELAPTGARLSGGSLWRLGCSEEAVRDTLAFLNDFRPDVFLPQCLPGFHHAAKWAGERGVPWVFTMHADDPVYWALAEQCGPDAAHGAWVVVSAYLADRVRDRFPAARVVTIPCGVAMPTGRATYRDRPFRVVYSGRLAEVQKRASLVAAALITACRRCESIEAVVLGEGTSRESMQQAVSAAGLTDRIRFAGRVPPERVGAELVNAQAILLMSDFEGLPVALLEAMAHGVVPVARSIASGIPELVHDGETGLLVDESPDRAAAAIVSLAADQRRWEAMSTAARRLVGDRYSDSVCFAAWRRLLDDLSRSERNVYPLPVTGRIALPPVHPALRGLDIRRPSLWQRVSRIAGSVGRRSRAAAARLLARQRHVGN